MRNIWSAARFLNTADGRTHATLMGGRAKCEGQMAICLIPNEFWLASSARHRACALPAHRKST
jgi:hypothetical protein